MMYRTIVVYMQTPCCGYSPNACIVTGKLVPTPCVLFYNCLGISRYAVEAAMKILCGQLIVLHQTMELSIIKLLLIV